MSGKTTIGKRIAETMNRRFVDLDDEIVKRENKSIPEIFDEVGEADSAKSKQKSYRNGQGNRMLNFLRRRRNRAFTGECVRTFAKR